jgi:UDP-N-acetylmuramyl pentapeptide phosphotransferase/UDP-N-acetylglucosamine-1-phosphate transferase
MYLSDFVIGVGVFAISLCLTRILSSPHSKVRCIDHPISRSLHSKPMPRTGGLAILTGLALGILLALPRTFSTGEHINLRIYIGVFVGSMIVALISFLDDLGGLPIKIRLGTHILVSTGIVLWGQVTTVGVFPRIEIFWLYCVALILIILWLAWMINLYNFMDGMDGLAGGMTIIGFGFLSYLGWPPANQSFAYISFITAASALGFLVYNFPPARIFMGDVGSTVLGFLAGVIALRGVNNGSFDFWVPLLIFSPFMVDSNVTLLMRLVRRERFWQAHRNPHYYARLILAGWTHRKTALIEYGLMIASGLSAIIYTRMPKSYRPAILIMWVVVYVLLICGVRRVERMSNSTASGMRSLRPQPTNLAAIPIHHESTSLSSE